MVKEMEVEVVVSVDQELEQELEQVKVMVKEEVKEVEDLEEPVFQQNPLALVLQLLLGAVMVC